MATILGFAFLTLCFSVSVGIAVKQTSKILRGLFAGCAALIFPTLIGMAVEIAITHLVVIGVIK